MRTRLRTRCRASASIGRDITDTDCQHVTLNVTSRSAQTHDAITKGSIFTSETIGYKAVRVGTTVASVQALACIAAVTMDRQSRSIEC